MNHPKIAVIGAGSSGLVTIRELVRRLPLATVVCYEKGNVVTGCWGNPYEGFVSTSTKFTTQFSGFRQYDLEVHHDAKAYTAFFRDGEYGQYLEAFADRFDLHRYIRFNTEVIAIRREGESWCVEIDDGDRQTLQFSHVILCTGVAEQPRQLDTSLPTLRAIHDIEGVRDKTVVVLGGGESAADIANRLADPARGNRVLLSLRQGIRVSPRYHPIRGVPSDFLRNRLLLSIDRGIRNFIGQKFVEARIAYTGIFRRLFPNPHAPQETADRSAIRRRKEWDLRLTASSKDQLFNVFHNKSDGFLDAVGDGRIQIVGPPASPDFCQYRPFDQQGPNLEVIPNLIVPRLGYQSRISRLFDHGVEVSDFYLGCLHVRHANLYLVGFARPIIGNIPGISEQQAKFIARTIAGEVERPSDIAQLHRAERRQLHDDYPSIDTDVLYPVEMFPYCDRLARRMGTYPTLKKVGSLRRWIRIQLSPASTLHYMDEDYDPAFIDRLPICTPGVLNLLLAVIRSCDSCLRLARCLVGRPFTPGIRSGWAKARSSR